MPYYAKAEDIKFQNIGALPQGCIIAWNNYYNADTFPDSPLSGTVTIPRGVLEFLVACDEGKLRSMWTHLDLTADKRNIISGKTYNISLGKRQDGSKKIDIT